MKIKVKIEIETITEIEIEIETEIKREIKIIEENQNYCQYMKLSIGLI